MHYEPFDFTILESRGVPFRTFDAGEKVFLEHETGDSMFVVRSGLIDIVTFGRVLERIGPNGLFGEMALIDDGERSAAALAAEPSELAVIDRAAFLDLVSHDARFALRIMHTLAERIRHLKALLL